MKTLLSLFTKKEKSKSYLELPAKTQKRILTKAAREASALKKSLVKNASTVSN